MSFMDNRPLLHTVKPVLRRYIAVFMLKDWEIGQLRTLKSLINILNRPRRSSGCNIVTHVS